MRVAVVEDDQETRSRTVAFFQRYERENHLRIEIEEYEDGRNLIRSYNPRFDLIFLDIEMKSMDGMTAAERIREGDDQVLLVFLTHMTGYAIRGYLVQASDYILKPLSYALFAEKMKEWVRRIERRRKESILISTGEETKRLSLDQIYYLEVIDHRVIYHTDAGNMEVWGNLKTAEEKLAGHDFVRCNKCYLVNLRHVQGIRQNQVQVGSDSLIISRPRRKEFMQALTDYIGES